MSNPLSNTIPEHPAVLNDRRALYGYHIDAEWETNEKKSVALKSIAWIDPDGDIAGQVDIISSLMLDDWSRDYWLVSVSNSVGDSLHCTPRAELLHADIFDTKKDAVHLFNVLCELEQQSSIEIQYDMPNDGWVAYRNRSHHRMLDLSHMDGIFIRLDGVFLTPFGKEHVKRWAFSNEETT